MRSRMRKTPFLTFFSSLYSLFFYLASGAISAASVAQRSSVVDTLLIGPLLNGQAPPQPQT